MKVRIHLDVDIPATPKPKSETCTDEEWEENCVVQVVDEIAFMTGGSVQYSQRVD